MHPDNNKDNCNNFPSLQSKPVKIADSFKVSPNSAYSLCSPSTYVDQMISLVSSAKGNRSMSEYADTIGTSVSTVSRILNGKTTRISDNVLAKIAETADPSSGVTLEDLVLAKGNITNKAYNQNAKITYKERCRMIIADALLQQGYSVSYDDIPEQFASPNGLFDFVIHTNAFEQNNKTRSDKWLFSCKEIAGIAFNQPGFQILQEWFESVMAHLYSGRLSAGRISAIITNVEYYDKINKYFSDLSIPDEISVIMIDLQSGKIHDEEFIPIKGTKETPDTYLL